MSWDYNLLTMNYTTKNTKVHDSMYVDFKKPVFIKHNGKLYHQKGR